jgi:hypothetical protein
MTCSGERNSPSLIGPRNSPQEIQGREQMFTSISETLKMIRGLSGPLRFIMREVQKTLIASPKFLLIQREPDSLTLQFILNDIRPGSKGNILAGCWQNLPITLRSNEI